MEKILRKFKEARLETCGQKKTKHLKSHKNGCYLRLTNKEIAHSDDSLWIVVDFDKNNEIRGNRFC